MIAVIFLAPKNLQRSILYAFFYVWTIKGLYSLTCQYG